MRFLSHLSSVIFFIRHMAGGLDALVALGGTGYMDEQKHNQTVMRHKNKWNAVPYLDLISSVSQTKVTE